METAKRNRVKVRVRYAETDRMGVAYYANYFVWFEVGRNEFLREQGLPYRELEAEGVFLPVTEAHCEYKRALGYDDLIEIQTWVPEVSAARIKFEYVITRGDEVVARGYTVHGFVDRQGRPMVPKRQCPRVWAEIKNLAFSAEN